jgi:capsular polysaccharide transport system permease protein
MAEEAQRQSERPAAAPAAAAPAEAAARARKPQPVAVAAVPEVKPPAAKPAGKPAPAEAERAKVVHIVRRLQEEANQKLTRRRKPWLGLSMLAAIALPTLLAALYFLFVAADRYVSEARFAVRSNDAQMADALGMITGLPASTVVSDSYIVADYVRSREMVAELERRLPLRQIYADPRADFLMRLDPTVSTEDLLAYWERRVDVFYDSTKNTIAVQVEAFNPGDAQRIVTEIVAVVRDLVNELSAQARRDAVQFAASELARAELRVRGARAAILDFRVANNDFDPGATVASTLQIVAQLEGERSKLNSQLASIKGYLSDSAPSVQMLKSRIAALEAEIARMQGEISHGEAGAPADSAALGALAQGGDVPPGAAQPGTAQPGDRLAPAGALASSVAKYQDLLLDQEFAEKSYAAAQASVERARAEADRTQSYLAIYMNPAVTDEAAYPRRILAILVTLIFATVAWGIAALITLTVKDHMS